MKKKILLILSIISITLVGVGGFVIRNNVNKPSFSGIIYEQELYGCPISRKNQKKKRRFWFR